MTAVCLALILIRILVLGNHDYPPLLINLTIAWLPLMLSFSILYCIRILSSNFLKLGIGTVIPIWLLFLPNAPYLLTDYVHVFANTSYDTYPLDNFLLWYDLILFFIYSLCGLMIWYISVWHFQTIVSRKLSKRTGWIFVCCVSFLTSFGIFLGRILRLNSWDVFLRPLSLGNGLIKIASLQCLSFTVFFGVFLFAMYLVLHFFRTQKTSY
jgi:uncharacterized membrane protein